MYVPSDTIILEKIVLHNATAITVAKIRIIITTIFLSSSLFFAFAKISNIYLKMHQMLYQSYSHLLFHT